MKSVIVFFGLVGLFLAACDPAPSGKGNVVTASEQATMNSEKKEVPIDGSQPAAFPGDSTGSFQKIKSVPMPQELTFAGERVPLERPDVRERLEFELYANCFRHSRTAVIIKRLHRWEKMMDTVLAQEGMPADFKYLAVAESELDNTAGSPVGASGMWQFMKGTGRDYGLTVNSYVDERRHPLLATQSSCRFLKNAYSKFESWTLVCAAYNMGPGALSQKMKEQEMDNYFDLFLYKETSRYMYRILAFKLILENPELYGFYIPEEERYAPREFKKVMVSETIPNLVTWAKEQGTNYRALRIYNPWFNNSSSYKLVVPKKESYEIWVPLL